MPTKLNNDWTRIAGAAIAAAVVGSGSGYWGGANASDDHIDKLAKEAAASAPAVVELKTDLKHLSEQVEKNCDKIQEVDDKVDDIKLNVHLLVRAAGETPVNGPE